MKIIIELTPEDKVSFLTENAETRTTGDVVNLLMFCADTIIEESKKQNNAKASVQLEKS